MRDAQAKPSDYVKELILDGVKDTPLVREGDQLFAKFDKIVLTEKGVAYLYRERVVAAQTCDAAYELIQGSTLTLVGIEGRMKIEIG